MYEFFQFIQTTAVYVAGIWVVLIISWYLTNHFARSYRLKNLMLRIIWIAFVLTVASGLLVYLMLILHVIQTILKY